MVNEVASIFQLISTKILPVLLAIGASAGRFTSVPLNKHLSKRTLEKCNYAFLTKNGA